MRNLITDWEALTDAETGDLVRPLALDKLAVYDSAELHGDRIVFSGSPWNRAVRPPRNLLERFVSATTDNAVLRFARSFGHLDFTAISPIGAARHREPLSLWRRFQSEFGLLLNVTAALREGSKVQDDPYSALEARRIPVVRMKSLNSFANAYAAPQQKWTDYPVRERQRRASALVLQRSRALVRLCGLRPALVEGGEPRRFELVLHDGEGDGSLSLVGALTAQFLAATTGTGFTTCSACGNVFVPKRRQPAFGKRRYCADCGRAAAVRAAKADYRARRREQRELVKARRAK